MLNHPSIEKLNALKLTGMAKAFREQTQTRDIGSISFEERLGLMIDREMTERENRRMALRMKQAKLREQASFENIDYKTARGLDRQLMMSLAACQWVKNRQNILISGPTGAGKTYIACALAHKACLEGYTAVYHRLPRLLTELETAKADGRYGRLLKTFGKTDVLILDDLGLVPVTSQNRRDLLELVEDRHGSRSTIIASQLPVNKWHNAIGDPTLADAILDRLAHNAHKITMKGESMRKTGSKLTNPGG